MTEFLWDGETALSQPALDPQEWREDGRNHLKVTSYTTVIRGVNIKYSFMGKGGS